MREQKYHLVFDEVERGIIIRSLNELRNRLLAEGRYTDAVDELLIKFVNAANEIEAPIRTKEDSTMAKSIFGEMDGTYEMQGDYFIPCFSLPPEKKAKPIGI